MSKPNHSDSDYVDAKLANSIALRDLLGIPPSHLEDPTTWISLEMWRTRSHGQAREPLPEVFADEDALPDGILLCDVGDCGNDQQSSTQHC